MNRSRIFIGLLGFYALACLAAGCASQKLLVESDPPGGTVYIDDKMMGKTPLALSYNELPYEENLTLRVEKQDFSSMNVIVQGPKLAGIGEKVRVKLSKAPDEAAELNAVLDRTMQAHKLALEHRYAESERIIDQLIADNPGLVAPRLLKGAILLMSKNYPLAQEQYQAALQIDPANEEATKMLNYLAKMPGSSGLNRFPASEGAVDDGGAR